MMPYTVKQALADAVALPPGKNLRLTFNTVHDAKQFRNGLSHVRRRDRLYRAARSGEGGAQAVSPWDVLGTRMIRRPDGSAQLEIGRWSGPLMAAPISKVAPVKVEVTDQERIKR